jgi:hypothetical protein
MSGQIGVPALKGVDGVSDSEVVKSTVDRIVDQALRLLHATSRPALLSLSARVLAGLPGLRVHRLVVVAGKFANVKFGKAIRSFVAPLSMQPVVQRNVQLLVSLLSPGVSGVLVMHVVDLVFKHGIRV